ncbi:heme ABC transporter ATP-binding protein [Thalassospira australica]|uniref:heme ABC transporter ATP-binding protein n=1 Tax=Thalassospira australica TaxID=1528106 RepID=UPI0006924B18|nr:heme ABC transporter ATP-binding protein [Thalassospira australica]
MSLVANKAGFVVRGRHLLRDVTVAVKPGEVLAVLGPNGAGKSTLLRVMAGEYQATSGTIHQNGQDVSQVAALALAQTRAVMPQAASMTFPFAVRDVVALGRAPFRRNSTRQFDQKLVDHAIRLADIDHLADRAYPALSGGEKQRVHLARALVQVWGMNNPETTGRLDHERDGKERFLLLDEPTAGLDVSHQHALLAVARREAHQNNVGVMMILHDFNQVTAYADRVAVLSAGEIVAQGPVSDIMEPGLLSSVFKSPIRAIDDPAGGFVLVSHGG